MPTATTISVILKDGSKREIPKGSTGLDLAKSISNSLLKKSVGLSLNGELKDLVTILKDDDQIETVRDVSADDAVHRSNRDGAIPGGDGCRARHRGVLGVPGDGFVRCRDRRVWRRAR